MWIFTVIFTDFLLVYNNKDYLYEYLSSCAYKIVIAKMIDYLDDNVLESDENYCFDEWILYEWLYYDLSEGIDLTQK